MSNGTYSIGLVGPGVMGRNFARNIADRGFTAAGYDTDAGQVRELAGVDRVVAATDRETFIRSLAQPRLVMLLVPAGRAVDAAINEHLPNLDPGDIVVDAGNSYFKNTNRRSKKLEKTIYSVGVGVSGGEAGPRHGPSIMPGRLREAYERVRPIFEATAAKVGGI